MRLHSKAVTAVTCAIAAYLAFAFGCAALKILASPIYGLEDYAFAQMILSSARMMGLSPHGVSLLAARFGALQLVVAIILLLAAIDRARALWKGEADSDLLEAGLVFAAAASIASMTPAITEAIHGIVRMHGLHLALAVTAGALSILERIERRQSRRDSGLHLAARQAAADAMTLLPPVRRAVTPRRWALLRRWANPSVG